MVAGYTGTHQRATYTCVGSTVNLAARLEAYTKEAGRPILMDGATHAQLGIGAGLVELGPVCLKGVAEPVELFGVA
jgi:adenylate cyclase